MSDKEKRKLLKKESPELLELIQDLKLAEVKNELEPLLQMVKDRTIPEGKGSAYLQTKFQLYMNYCTNISYYLFLKAKRLLITGHHVIKRLVTYGNLITTHPLPPICLSPEVHLLLTEEFQKNPGVLKPQNGQPKASKKAAVKCPLGQPQQSDSDMDEEDALNYYKMMENKLREKRKRGETETVDEEPTEETDPNAKRAITYQIAKK